MAPAARPLKPARPAPPRSRGHLRAVPEGTGRSPRRGRPSKAVIRRRRLVALGGLASLIALPLAVLSLGGGPVTDAGRIEDLLARGALAPQTLCDHLSRGMLDAIGGNDACVAASPERGPGATVSEVRVDGSTATAVVSSDQAQERVRLVREDGEWKVDDVR